MTLKNLIILLFVFFQSWIFGQKTKENIDICNKEKTLLKDKVDSLEFQISKLTENIDFQKVQIDSLSKNLNSHKELDGFSKIGDQFWMNTNLDVTSLSDGTKLIWAQSKEDWDSCYIKNIPAYCFHDKDTSSENGLLYNIHALRSGELAPKGCTIPTELDVETLIKSFGTFQLSASLLLKSKEPNTWTKPGLDLFNMNIKPYGVRLGEDRYFGEKVYFYCETIDKESLVFYVISDSADKINLLKRNISLDNVYYGLYVRCIKNK